MTVELETLLSDYRDNEIAADRSYKGKRIRAHGIVGAAPETKTEYLEAPIPPRASAMGGATSNRHGVHIPSGYMCPRQACASSTKPCGTPPKSACANRGTLTS